MASCHSSSSSGPLSRSDSDSTWSSRSSQVKDFSWSPGGGVPNYPFGSAEERATRDRLHRTSLLFMELQQQVHDCVGRKRTHEARESAESYRIAMAHPMKPAAPVPASPAAAEPVFKRMPSGEYVAVFETPAQRTASAEEEQHAAATRHAAEEQETVTKKVRILALSPLPEPIKREDLDAAYAQLPKGAEVAIEGSIKMWREKRLELSELMTTVKSFQNQAPVLKSLLHTLGKTVPAFPVECEVATPEQMRVLSALLHPRSDPLQST
mmetsp:Transcript_33343/g.76239  ORF Transcript_33343/g.76239 Transcript_33343/m.76239 type:complete len:267 (-) Transcript_33343:252-1052(-)